MTISLGNAISCIKQDEKWKSKTIVGGVIFVILPIILGLILGILEGLEVIPENSLLPNAIINVASIIFGVYVIGFIFTSMNRVMNSSDSFKMANWNEKNLMLTGVKSTLACSGWALMTLLVFGVGLVLTCLVFILAGSFICTLIHKSSGIELEAFKPILIAISGIVGSIYGLYLAQFINNAFACYLKTLKFKDLIAFKKHFQIIKENKHKNWTLVGKNILFSLAIILTILVLTLTIVGIVLLPFVFFLAYFVSYNLVAQYAKAIDIDKYLND